MSKAYPELTRYSTSRLKRRLDAFKQEWEKARKGGMRLDSFSALYLGGEIERMEALLEQRR